MQNELLFLDEIVLIGTTVRTNNKNEMNPETSKIGKHFQTYFQNKVAENFKDRCSPNTTYSIYTEYGSDEQGEFTHFIGEVVKNSIEDYKDSKFKKLIIPACKYKKFTTSPGTIPDNVIKAWQEIWKLDSLGLGGKRCYIADFEIYDQRAYQQENSIVDIFIGIK
ncbi:AraC family transcriptional regulator [Silvanigrella paludirubra]|uniref:AraC family transcriptional regulator n=1 Tax=Silvanigrella paludirubra TaxID=2499159 RepID=A0A6N6W0J9_9BACT|nr:effector binding domain-containing protein [Silvanigrella paludirubra]KAB8040818.1 AraC family transcriptional regulator [Silvanigrella paludirubra]